jgi:hypothetical protein
MKKRNESTGEEQEVAKNDIIQVNQSVPHWFRCLLVVDEVRSWGVQAYCAIPAAHGATPGDAYIRLTWDQFDLVGGRNIWQVAESDEGG